MTQQDNALPRLSLSAIPWFWPRQQLFDFYADIARLPIDIVYLGEVVCSKRRELDLDDWIAIADTLERAGKQVCLSTLTLLEAGSELGAMRRLCRQSQWLVEANDIGAAYELHRKGNPFVAGHTLNLYNPRAISHMRSLGMLRWMLPVELGRDALAGMLSSGVLDGLETEVFAWGRLPLAWSARCYTARAENRGKDQCDWVCLKDPDGRLMRTREDEPFLNLNGIQTQSALTHSLAGHICEARSLGADILRLTPQAEGMPQIIKAFDDLRQQKAPDQAMQTLQTHASVGICDGYWRGEAGMVEAAIQ